MYIVESGNYVIKFHCLQCYVHLCNAPICDHNILFVSIVGNLGIFRPELFVFPESESGVSDNGNIIILILADISSHKLLLLLCLSSSFSRNRIQINVFFDVVHISRTPNAFQITGFTDCMSVLFVHTCCSLLLIYGNSNILRYLI